MYIYKAANCRLSMSGPMISALHGFYLFSAHNSPVKAVLLGSNSDLETY